MGTLTPGGLPPAQLWRRLLLAALPVSAFSSSSHFPPLGEEGELEEVLEVVESSLLVLSRPSRLLWDNSSGLILL